jgi:hypothetical protein
MAHENKKPINWELLSMACQFYEEEGYQYVEVPWMLDEVAGKATMPRGIVPFRVDSPNHSLLIGSAEQGFFAIKETLKPDVLYYSVSPCFRPETGKNLKPGFRQTEFMKLELFSLDPGNVPSMIQSALDGFDLFSNTFCSEHYLKSSGKMKTVATPEGYDILINNKEIGSYGHRSWSGWTWAYGTGLALPRFEYVIENMKGEEVPGKC